MNADDRQAILDLISSYSYTYAAHDIERLGALFCQDAVLTFQTTSLTGSGQIQEAMSARRRWLAEQGIQPRHYQTNSTLTAISQGHVRGRTMLLVTWQRAGESAPMVAHTGIYDDEFRKTAEGWRFFRRSAVVDHD